MSTRDVEVHLTPSLAPAGRLTGGVAVAVDVLRATTTLVHAFASGCATAWVCAEVDEARAKAATLPAGAALLAGERGGVKLPGFDLGNSPKEYSARVCRGKTLVFTSTNGTRALVRASEAETVYAAAFVNLSATLARLRADRRPVHVVCAGYEGEPALEDTLFAGALVDGLSETEPVRLNDSARLAWDAYENHRDILAGALEVCRGGAHLIELGFGGDLKAALEIDKFTLVPELRRDPLRLEAGGVGVVTRPRRK